MCHWWYYMGPKQLVNLKTKGRNDQKRRGPEKESRRAPEKERTKARRISGLRIWGNQGMKNKLRRSSLTLTDS